MEHTLVVPTGVLSETNPPPRSKSLAMSAASLLRSGEHEAEVLAYLANQSTPSIILEGLIRDNGFDDSLNRGRFYGFRGRDERLQGVALIGQITTFETETDAALAAFAYCAQNVPRIGVIIGEQTRVETFWRRYAGDGQAPPQLTRELLFELQRQSPGAPAEPVRELRVATLTDIEMVVTAHAEMSFNESGINPIAQDAQGFRARCARRIKQGRVWVLTDAARLIFKADIITETPRAIYVEGVYVAPEERGRGYGFRCVSQLGTALLARVQSIFMLINEQNVIAQNLYRKAGYEFRSHYDTIFIP